MDHGLGARDGETDGVYRCYGAGGGGRGTSGTGGYGEKRSEHEDRGVEVEDGDVILFDGRLKKWRRG